MRDLDRERRMLRSSSTIPVSTSWSILGGGAEVVDVPLVVPLYYIFDESASSFTCLSTHRNYNVFNTSFATLLTVRDFICHRNWVHYPENDGRTVTHQ